MVLLAAWCLFFGFRLGEGLHAGLEASAVYSLIHMAMPGSYIVDPIQALLNYPIAYAALGLAGMFQNYPLVGVGVGIAGRFLAHFTSGVCSFGNTPAP